MDDEYPVSTLSDDSNNFSNDHLNMLRYFLLVGAGGAIGSMMRYGVGVLLSRPVAGGFPAATFIINLTGCLLIGLLAGVAARGSQWMSTTGWPLLAAGVCGGFTTFSAFSLEVLRLLQTGAYGMAGAYILLSIVAGILLCFAGYWMTSL